METLCGGIEYRLLCVSTQVGLPIKQFIALPIELQLVTDTGNLHCICGIVAHAIEGQSDGGLATYQLVLRDALTIMEKRINTRVFRNASEIDITDTIIGEWRQNNPVLARAFKYDLGRLVNTSPAREFTMQSNESDSAFLRRLWKRRGIAWFFEHGKATEVGSDDTPAHTLVLFDDNAALKQNIAGIVRYHRDDGTEQSDSITGWHAVRTLTAGSVTRQSWDYVQAAVMTRQEGGRNDQGTLGNQFAASIDDHLIDVPHAGDNGGDYAEMTTRRMQHHEYISKCFHAESGLRTLYPGQWIGVTGHAEIDTHPASEREFVITELRIAAENNLPKALNEKIERLFALNRWQTGSDAKNTGLEEASAERNARYSNQFTCVRRGVPIVPSYDPRTDLPRMEAQSVVVVGPPGEEVHCDRLGRVKVRFPGCRPDDHSHAHGAGTSDSDRDSAWVRVASSWASAQYGANSLPRPGDECIVEFMEGDPDKPVIIARVHGGTTTPPTFSHTGGLPGNRYLSGIKSKEIRSLRYNQLRMDDTPGQISAQLASEHGHSQLNLGHLTHPRSEGKGTARGEGAELRSDEHIALRAAKGILLSAWARLNAVDSQLARAEYLSLMEHCLDQFRTLGNYAAEHEALPLDDKPQAELNAAMKKWDNGSNTAPEGQDGGAPVIALTSPAGLSFATPMSQVSYAGVNIDSVAQQNMQLTAGQRYNLNAGKGISLFSHHDGIKAIAHHGKLLLQSQHDDTEINAAKNIRCTATDGKIIGMAKEIHHISEDGCFIKIGGGGITIGTSGAITFKAADFVFTGPATMATDLPKFDSGTPDQKFLLKYGPHGEGAVTAPNRHFEIDMSDGTTLKGISDAAGKTPVLLRDAMHIASVRILPDKA